MDGKRIDQDPMQMPSWSIGMACVWIVHRAPEAASRLWSGDLIDAWLTLDNGPNVEIQDARTELVNALVTGGVQATGLLVSGQRVPIPALEWEDMTFSYDLRDDDGLLHRAESAGGNLYTDIRVNRSTVLKKWPAEQARTAAIIAFPAPKSSDTKPRKKATGQKRGRPHKYAWPDFTAQVIEVMEEEGDFDVACDPNWNQAKLEVRMLQWCKNRWGMEPSESTVREKVKKGLIAYREKRKG